MYTHLRKHSADFKPDLHRESANPRYAGLQFAICWIVTVSHYVRTKLKPVIIHHVCVKHIRICVSYRIVSYVMHILQAALHCRFAISCRFNLFQNDSRKDQEGIPVILPPHSFLSKAWFASLIQDLVLHRTCLQCPLMGMLLLLFRFIPRDALKSAPMLR